MPYLNPWWEWQGAKPGSTTGSAPTEATGGAEGRPGVPPVTGTGWVNLQDYMVANQGNPALTNLMGGIQENLGRQANAAIAARQADADEQARVDAYNADVGKYNAWNAWATAEGAKDVGPRPEGGVRRQQEPETTERYEDPESGAWQYRTVGGEDYERHPLEPTPEQEAWEKANAQRDWYNRMVASRGSLEEKPKVDTTKSEGLAGSARKDVAAASDPYKQQELVSRLSPQWSAFDLQMMAPMSAMNYAAAYPGLYGTLQGNVGAGYRTGIPGNPLSVPKHIPVPPRRW